MDFVWIAATILIAVLMHFTMPAVFNLLRWIYQKGREYMVGVRRREYMEGKENTEGVREGENMKGMTGREHLEEMTGKEYMEEVQLEGSTIQEYHEHEKLELNTVFKAIIDAQAEWYNIGLELGLTPGVLNGVSGMVSRPKDCLRETLTCWINGVEPQPTWERLVKALKSPTVGKSQLAEDVEDKYCCQAKHDQSGRREKYSEYLKCNYRQLAPVKMLQWPQLRHYEFVSLAMIKEQTIRFEDMDEFTRLSIHGKCDDILREKEKIELKQMFFKKEKNTRQVILIEGAPGAGKTMLVWHICQEWSENKLFTQFRIIILATLRDPTVQGAKSITDVLLLPPNQRDAQEVASKMKACHGRGVLFLLDGWDELPEEKRELKTFFFRELIEEPLKHSLDEAAIIVTSRPVSSSDLRPHVSSRIEIVGFISSKLKEYFETCLKSEKKHEVLDKLLHTVEDNPLIGSICYLPLNAAIVVYLFLACGHKLPSTYHELFQLLVLHCIMRDEERGNQSESKKLQNQRIFPSFEELPEDIKEHFRQICQLAYSATKENKIALSSDDLGKGVLNKQLGLLQAVPRFGRYGKETMYHFLHLSLQELLTAYHISTLTPAKQVEDFEDLYKTPRFSAVFGFYAGFTKFKIEGIQDIIARIVQDEKSSDKEKTLLVSLMNWLYEAQDTELCNFVQRELTTDQNEKPVGGNGVLNLSCTSLKPSDTLSVGYFLSTVGTTAGKHFHADLSSCSIEDHHVRFLAKGLSHCEPPMNRACVEMNLSNNNIREGIKDIAVFLEKSKVIKALNLGRNKLSDSALPLFVRALTCTSSLTALDISQCSLKLTGEVGKSLSTMLEKAKSLLSLDISHSVITPDCIADGLTRNSGLKTLCMRFCNVKAEEMRRISEAIRNSKLEELSIGPLGDDCMEPLAIAIKSLRSLTLRGEGITNQGLKILGGALQEKNSLLELNLLDFHSITCEGLKELGEQLKTNQTLQELALIRIIGRTTTDGLKHLVLCLQRNSTLKSLKLSKNEAENLYQVVDKLNESRQHPLKLEPVT